MSNRRTLVALDDDTHALREIEEIAKVWMDVATTRSPQRALTMIHNNPAACVLVTAQKLSASSGLAVLRAAQTLRPSMRRILLSAPGQLGDVIEGLHSGAIEHIIYKPIRSHDLIAALGTLASAPVRAGASH